MNQNQRRTSVIVLASILMFAIVFSGFASAQKVNVNENEDDDFKEMISNIPPTNPNILEMQKGEKNILAIKGKIPKIEKGVDVYEWQKTLNKVSESLQESNALALYRADNTVIGQGVHADGFIIIMLDENKDISSREIDKIETIVKEHANKFGISEIPIVFSKEQQIIPTAVPDPSTIYLYPYFNQYRPIIGGIGLGIEIPTLNQVAFGTIAFAAEDSNNQKGFVTAGHTANFETGSLVYQPKYIPSNYIANVSVVGTDTDAVFVPYDNVDAKLHIANGYTIDVDGYYSGGITNMDLGSSGIVSGYTTASYLGVGLNLTIAGHQIDKVEYMDYICQHGDSGGPVYYTYNGRNKLIGMVVGTGSYKGTPATVYIPCDEIISKLDVEPLEA